MAISPEVPSRVGQLADQLAHAQPMRRGSLSERTIRCGKAGCACADNPKARHGPYHSLTQAVKGKTRSRFLTEEQAAEARQQIAAFDKAHQSRRAAGHAQYSRRERKHLQMQVTVARTKPALALGAVIISPLQ